MTASPSKDGFSIARLMRNFCAVEIRCKIPREAGFLKQKKHTNHDRNRNRHEPVFSPMTRLRMTWAAQLHYFVGKPYRTGTFAFPSYLVKVNSGHTLYASTLQRLNETNKAVHWLNWCVLHNPSCYTLPMDQEAASSNASTMVIVRIQLISSSLPKNTSNLETFHFIWRW